jgi:hypothetical protein
MNGLAMACIQSWRKVMKLGMVIGLGALALAGCTPSFITDNSSSMVLEISGINDGAAIQSDVLTDGIVVNDDAEVSVNLFRKNPSVTSTSALEHVYLESYDVRYFRTDGKDIEGVDVPYRISGPLGNVRFHTPTSTGENELTVPITIVRQAAKLEPPLRNLRAGGGQLIITAIAEISVYARQIDGETLKATGRVQVTFADFGSDSEN